MNKHSFEIRTWNFTTLTYPKINQVNPSHLFHKGRWKFWYYQIFVKFFFNNLTLFYTDSEICFRWLLKNLSVLPVWFTKIGITFQLVKSFFLKSISMGLGCTLFSLLSHPSPLKSCQYQTPFWWILVARDRIELPWTWLMRPVGNQQPPRDIF